VIDRLAANNIDLTRMPVEVAPIAHYHMGGVKADAAMATDIAGLFVAGEVVGGANGANRLSGNAITEALVFGRRAGRNAAARAAKIARQSFRTQDANKALDLVRAGAGDSGKNANAAEMVAHLQATMADNVGPIRTEASLARALDDIAALAATLGRHPFGRGDAFDSERLDWFDLRNMLAVAHAVVQAAHDRRESRGAHQRVDFPGLQPQWQVHQEVRLSGGKMQISGTPEEALAS
jgi:succinate dehydrogenase / fumarate reductase, flavoprotein subunit